MEAHRAIKAYRQAANLSMEIPNELQEYNWDEAFGVAGDLLETGYDDINEDSYNKIKHNSADIRPSREQNISLVPFDRRDIQQLIAYAEGERDRLRWLALMKLWDGRYAFLSAGCDYTGWD